MGNMADAVGAGLVKSLARPGGNVTGLSNLSVEISSKHIELLQAALPRLSRVAVMTNRANTATASIPLTIPERRQPLLMPAGSTMAQR